MDTKTLAGALVRSGCAVLAVTLTATLWFGCGWYSPDTDNDWIRDKEDQCPYHPEDRDGFKDEDGCPDRDDDEDRILDVDDDCPLVPEDRDGIEDEDGCPETHGTSISMSL